MVVSYDVVKAEMVGGKDLGWSSVQCHDDPRVVQMCVLTRLIEA